MFDEYAKKIEELGANSPKVFKTVALWGAKYAENTAKNITDKEGTVDTGNYKRNWSAHRIEPQKDIYGITLENNTEYASFLEDGYVLKKDYFVPFDKMEGTPKTQAFIARFKAKYPNAKGFTRKAGRYKGHKVGRQALVDTEGTVLLRLREEIETLMLQKKHSLSHSEAIKYLD